MFVLFLLLTAYTIAYLALMGCDFAARERFEIPKGLMVVYMGLVVAYAADKEIRRWMRKEIPSLGRDLLQDESMMVRQSLS